MATATTLETGKRVFANLDKILYTPYTDEDTIGSTVYELGESLIGDSVSIIPDDNTVNVKESETNTNPAFENVVLGKAQFAANLVDMQDTILKEMIGWTVDATNKFAARPDSYEALFAKIELYFNSTDSIIVLPKVKINSKALFSTFNSGSGEAQLAGTAYTQKYKIGTAEGSSSVVVIADATALATATFGSEIVVTPPAGD